MYLQIDASKFMAGVTGSSLKSNFTHSDPHKKILNQRFCGNRMFQRSARPVQKRIAKRMEREKFMRAQINKF